MKRIACIGTGLTLFFALLSRPGAAQSSGSQNPAQSNSAGSGSDSLGDYAKQIRKSGPTSKPKVFDNDNLPTDDKLSVVGTPAPADTTSSGASQAATTTASTAEKADGGTKTGDNKPPAPAGASEDEKDAAKQALWKSWGDKVAAQKDQIDLITRELNVLQREYQIRAAAMYGDAGNRLRNEGDWDKQDAQYKQQLADKQKALDDAKQKLDDMQEEARKAGVPSSFLGE